MTTLVLSLLLAQAQPLPEGPGRAETEKLCKGCHEMARSISKRQDRDAWLITMNRMSGFGMRSSDAEFKAVLAYLTTHYPADEIPRVNINTAKAIELESALGLRRSQASALIAYRNENGPFKAIEDLKKIPQLDFAKIEANKDRIAF
jgi:competence ComEA-like helix-hairpin-helix protein